MQSIFWVCSSYLQVSLLLDGDSGYLSMISRLGLKLQGDALFTTAPCELGLRKKFLVLVRIQERRFDYDVCLPSLRHPKNFSQLGMGSKFSLPHIRYVDRLRNFKYIYYLVTPIISHEVLVIYKSVPPKVTLTTSLNFCVKTTSWLDQKHTYIHSMNCSRREVFEE